MISKIKIALIAAGASLAMLVGAYAVLNASGPTNEQLSADIGDLDKRIENARSVGERFAEGSLLRPQSDLELVFLRSTRAMLDQKRKAWLRRISLSYNADMGWGHPADPETIRAINSEIEEAKQKTTERTHALHNILAGFYKSQACWKHRRHV